MDRLLGLELTSRKRRLNTRSQHLGPGFNPCRRVQDRSDDGGLKPFSKKLRYPRKILDRGKWDIQVIDSITVSRLPQRADHELVVEALCGELGCQYSELRLRLEGASFE